MASKRITELTALAAAAVDSLFVVVDVDDPTMALTGTNKKITYADLFAGVLKGANNLSDLADKAAARANLGCESRGNSGTIQLADGGGAFASGSLVINGGRALAVSSTGSGGNLTFSNASLLSYGLALSTIGLNKGVASVTPGSASSYGLSLVPHSTGGVSDQTSDLLTVGLDPSNPDAAIHKDGSIKLPVLADANAANSSFYLGSDHGDALCYKDVSGVVATYGGGGGTPGGSSGQLQWNNGGAFAGLGAWDDTNKALTLAGTIGGGVIYGSDQASGNLKLVSTTDTSKGFIYLGSTGSTKIDDSGSLFIYTITHQANSFIFGTSYFEVANTYQVKWSGTSSCKGAADAGLVRESAGLIKVSDGQAGLGNLHAGWIKVSQNSEPATTNLASGEAACWLDPTPGAAKFGIVAKDSGGTVVRGSVPLA